MLTISKQNTEPNLIKTPKIPSPTCPSPRHENPVLAHGNLVEMAGLEAFGHAEGEHAARKVHLEQLGWVRLPPRREKVLY